MKPRCPHLISIIAVTLAAITAMPALSQKLGVIPPSADCSSDVNFSPALNTRYRALREIEDPSTHQRWLLIRDRERAAGPALFVKGLHCAPCAFFASGTINCGSSYQPPVRHVPVMHAGDRVILSEHPEVSDAELESTALEPAAPGDALRVRLRFGGFTARAIATASGHATLSPAARTRRP